MNYKAKTLTPHIQIQIIISFNHFILFSVLSQFSVLISIVIFYRNSCRNHGSRLFVRVLTTHALVSDLSFMTSKARLMNRLT